LSDRLAQKQIDVVINLAWLRTETKGYQNDEANYEWGEIAVQLCRAAIETSTLYIGVGSGLEKSEEAERTPYRQAKDKARRECLALDSASVLWVRPFWVFSLEDRRPRLINDALAAKERDLPFHPASPNQQHDFIEVRDVASAILLLVLNGRSGEQDIGSGRLRSVRELVAAAWGSCETLDSALRMPLEKSDNAADIGGLWRLGWRPVNTESFFSNYRQKEC
jgi:nucleoside-diphosphate-sugar epimerase